MLHDVAYLMGRYGEGRYACAAVRALGQADQPRPGVVVVRKAAGYHSYLNGASVLPQHTFRHVGCGNA